MIVKIFNYRNREKKKDSRAPVSDARKVFGGGIFGLAVMGANDP